MPGFAGSSAYYLRYMDPRNRKALVGKEANQYWRNVDLYVGGSEHATGHLIYARFFNQFLFDLGHIVEKEPFKKLINQGMIQGRSNFVYRKKGTNTFVSLGKLNEHETTAIHVDISLVDNDVLDIKGFKKWRAEYEKAEFILEDGKYICGHAVEKMSKSKFNVVDPDQVVEEYGADTLRLFEMFLGPIEQSKPWNTNSIEGVSRYLHKLWNFCFDEANELILTDDKATADELKVLHTAIKKVQQDIENFSMNTAVSALMIALNDFQKMGAKKKCLIRPYLLLLAPFAPHIAEEIWSHIDSQMIDDQSFPELEEKYLIETTFNYPISFNGKMRFLREYSLELDSEALKQKALSDEESKKYIGDKKVVKVIAIPKKIINIVLK